MSDGNFKWWHAPSYDDESWQGPFDSRADAISNGRHEWNGEAFAICEADKMSLGFSGIFDGYSDEDLSADDYEIDTAEIFNLFIEQNADCWGDDGPEEIEASTAQCDELTEALRAAQALPEGREEAMSQAFENWCEAHPDAMPTVWSFGTIRNKEDIPASAPATEGAK